MIRSAFLLSALVLGATPIHATVIEAACMQSDRKQANWAVCSCIQKVADAALSAEDQAEAAKFFEDPQLAQETRMSKDPKKEAFWDRYKEWTEKAADSCG